MIYYTIYSSKVVGDIILYGDANYLYGLEFYKDNFVQNEWIENNSNFKHTINELNLYFQKRLKKFTIPLKLSGTDFQQKVFKVLQTIPYGKTISYQELAKKTGNKKASRAVGNANGKNPIAIIIPCHRVIAKNGTIGGYSGGLDIKRKLLKLEGIEI